MEMNNRFELGQVVYYFEVIDNELKRLKSSIEAILIEKGFMNSYRYSYLVDKCHWKQEHELCATEDEADWVENVGE